MESLAEKFNLNIGRNSIRVTFDSDKPKTVKTIQSKLNIKLNNGHYLDISANFVTGWERNVHVTASVDLYSGQIIV